jgi:hypothetical protein
MEDTQIPEEQQTVIEDTDAVKEYYRLLREMRQESLKKIFENNFSKET